MGGVARFDSPSVHLIQLENWSPVSSVQWHIYEYKKSYANISGIGFNLLI